MIKPHWTRWYNRKRWRNMRAHQLAREPLCAFCKSAGKIEPAIVVDHVEKHFGDPIKFWTGKLQSLCWACHETRKKFVEARGYTREIDPETGWPKDERHPANLPRDIFRRWGYSIPHNIRKSNVPVTLVCGPPAAGKTTWVNAHKRPGDTVISLDECKARVGGRMWDTDRRILRRALAFRDAMLRSLAVQAKGRAYVVVGAPTEAERKAWCEALGVEPEHVVIMATSAEVCIERLQRDPERAHAAADLTNGVKRWHHHYQGARPIRSSDRSWMALQPRTT
jgi:predicted kinase